MPSASAPSGAAPAIPESTLTAPILQDDPCGARGDVVSPRVAVNAASECASATDASPHPQDAAPPSSAEAQPPPPPLPWYRRRVVRLLATRVAIRLVALAVLVTLLRVFGRQFRAAGDAYLEWITSLGPAGGGATFFVVASAFCAVSPTGYLPSVAAGITFPLSAAIPISYLCVFVGALLNVGLVRGLLHNWGWLRSRCRRRASTAVGGLEAALARHPFRIVALLRLPFLGNGALNYIISLSPVPLAPMTAGNAVGLLPGAVLFAVAGAQVRSLGSIIASGGQGVSPTAIGVLVAVSVTVVVSFFGVVVITRRVGAAERARVAAEVAAEAAATAAAAAATQIPDSGKCPALRHDEEVSVEAIAAPSSAEVAARSTEERPALPTARDAAA